MVEEIEAKTYKLFLEKKQENAELKLSEFLEESKEEQKREEEETKGEMLEFTEYGTKFNSN